MASEVDQKVPGPEFENVGDEWQTGSLLDQTLDHF